MIKNMTIKKKMMIFILGITVTIYSLTMGYTLIKMKSEAIKEAKKLADTYTSNKANQIKSNLEEDMAITRAMAVILQEYVSLPSQQREELQYKLMNNLLREYPRYAAIWMSWQLQFIDSTWHKEYGRLSINSYWEGGEVKNSEERKNLEGFDLDGLYYRLLTNQEEVLTEPYEFDSYDLRDNRKLLAVSPTKTLINDEGISIGVIGIDLSLESYMEMVEIEGFDEGYVFLLSNNGTIVAHSDANYSNLPIDTLEFYNRLSDYNLKEIVEKGNSVATTVYSDKYSGDAYLSIAPIPVGRSNSPWSVGIIVPYSEITKTVNSTFQLMVLLGGIGIIFLTIVIWNISKEITTSLEKTNVALKGISIGDINTKNLLAIDSKNRLGQMSASVNKLMKELVKKAQFAKHIGEGNLTADYKEASDKDILGQSLISMRNNIKKSNEEEANRRWATEGLAKFADILQSDAQDMGEFCSEIISNLVKYIGAIQGGMFLINDDNKEDQYIELKGAYAYERKKFLTKRIEMGEGLVGQCILEKKYIYLKEIPQDYLNVTSGLGKANPDTILIVPLILNNEVYGAIELASFNEFAFYEVEFVEKLSENIASTISSVKTNYKTKKLLEQSNIQAEELQAQEEEMRQNMEELQATQEEMVRKEIEYLEKIAELERDDK